MTPFTRRVSHKQSLTKKLAVHRVLYPSGLRLGSSHQEPLHTDVYLATVVIRGVLPGAKEKKNWTVAQWSKVLFSDESKYVFVFHLETKVLESAEKVEKLIAQVA